MLPRRPDEPHLTPLPGKAPAPGDSYAATERLGPRSPQWLGPRTAAQPTPSQPREAGPLGARHVPTTASSSTVPHLISSRPGRAAGPVYRGLPRPLKLILGALATVTIGGVLGATAPTALMRLGAVAALQPGLLAWYTARTIGFLAYLVVAGSVLYGLLLSTKILDAIAHRPISFALHKDLSIVGLLLGAVHGTVLLVDQSYSFTPRAILVPFASPYAPVWVGIGQLAFYGLAIVTASFYVRRQIGQRAWRLLHYLTFAVFLGTTAHGIMSGSDSGTPWAFWVYLVPSSAAVFLLVYRIVLSISAHALHPASERSAVPALIARAPQPNPSGRVPSDRPAALLEPPELTGTFD
jgi:hypothetical protein